MTTLSANKTIAPLYLGKHPKELFFVRLKIGSNYVKGGTHVFTLVHVDILERILVQI